MKPIVIERVDKTEGDFATMEREARARKNPNYDGVCFHAQQCAEKYLKAVASEFAVSFRYPGDSADRESAKDARRRCRIFRRAARSALGLPA
jgi:hypothetical protein